ncbi:MFS transporter [Halorussus salinisoli]|uniref:MFS transporter n=1 Tax=Halorussus salinisoli TaxID=2558242 RepID=UPI0010C21122|nr:MFS transporter [Halorussus salinisoli]
MSSELDSATDSTRPFHERLHSLWAENRIRILVTVSLSWMLTLGVRLSIPVLMPWIQRDFSVGLTGVGGILSLVWAVYAVSQFPGGILADRFGERVVLAGSTFLSALALTLIAVSTGFWVFIGCVVLFGIASGLFATTRFTVLSDVFPDNEGTVIGLSAAAGNVGTTLLPIIAGQVALLIGWRYSFVAMAPGLLIAAAGLRTSVPTRTSTPASGGDGLNAMTVLRAVRNPASLLGASAMFFMSFVYQAFTGFYPTYLVQVKGFDEGTAALLYGAFFAAGIFLQPVGGLLGDRYGKRRTILVSAALTGLVLALVPATGGIGPILALSALASVQLCFWPSAQAYVIDTLPERLQGGGFGLLRTAYLALAASGPLVVGALASAAGFTVAFYVLSFAAGVAVLIGLLLTRFG